MYYIGEEIIHMKKILVFIIVLISIFSLAACRGNNNSTSNKNDNSNSSISQNNYNTKLNESITDDNPEFDAEDPQGSINLISIGNTATATLSTRSGVKHSVSMCVEEIFRGEAALSFINDNMMAAKSMWSAESPTEEDQEYIVAKITYTLLAFDEGDTREASPSYAFTGDLEPYPNLAAAMYYDKDNNYPELFRSEVKAGETITAYEIFQISKEDPSPVMAYANNLADLSDGLWFKLY